MLRYNNTTPGNRLYAWRKTRKSHDQTVTSDAENEDQRYDL